MSEPQASPGQGAETRPGAAAADPSMEDILASIRRILSEDEAQAAPEPAPSTSPTSAESDDDVLVLDESMLAADGAPSLAAGAPAMAEPALPSAAEPEPLSASGPLPSAAGHNAPLLAPDAADAAASAMETLVRTLADRPDRDKQTALSVRSGGPTIEDIVREEIRPLLKAWLDANLPTLTERLVREELFRLVGRVAR